MSRFRSDAIASGSRQPHDRHEEHCRCSDDRKADPDVLFEALDPQLVLDLGEEVWSSPPTALGATIFLPRRVPEQLLALPVAGSLPILDEPQRVYLIGHAGGAELKISINDNDLLDP